MYSIDAARAREDTKRWVADPRRAGQLLRLSAGYTAVTAAAAERLATWWQQQPGIAVKVEQLEPTPPEEIEAAVREHVATARDAALWLAMRKAREWRVSAETPAARLIAADVDAWFDLLARLPEDAEWALTSVSLYDGWSGPEA